MTSAPPSAPTGRIAALDGVRAVSVLVVLAFHVHLPGFSAGFLGVDAFFVLSGYLITGLLLRDLREYGHVRFGVFWSRRVRRLLPAALLVVAAIIVWGSWAAPGFQRTALRTDVIATLLNAANWRFITTSSYFASDGAPSPLQHTWSLAVEEQFYLIWPLVIGLVGLLLHRRGMLRARTAAPWAVGVVAGLGTVLSAVLLAVLYDPNAPERAYMGTDARAFEPLLGAFLACLTSSERVRGLVRAGAGPAIVLGLFGLAAGVTLLGSSGDAGAGSTYYRGGALAVSGACGLMVVGAALGHVANPVVRVLGTRPAAWLGRISYGIYLWHWPLAVWLVPHDGTFSPVRAVAVVVLSVLAAALSFTLIEQRVQNRRIASQLTPRRLAVVVPVVLLLGIGSAGAAVREPAAGPTTMRIMLVGDSVPSRLFPAVYAEGAHQQRAVLNSARGACPALGVQVTDAAGAAFTPGIDCAALIPALQSKNLRSFRPNVVVWWSRYELADRLSADGKHLAAGTPAFWAAQRADLRSAVRRLSATGAVVVIVRTDRPGTGMSSRCTPTKCHPFLRRLVDEDDLRIRWNGLLDEEAARNPRVRLVDIDDVYCTDAAVPCDDRAADGHLARPDGTHFSDAAMPAVAHALLSRTADAAS